MFIKLIEVFSEMNHGAKAFDNIKRFHLRELVINTNYIVSLKEESSMQYYLEKGHLPEGLKKEQAFTNLTLMKGHIGTDTIVVGSLESIQKIINSDEKGLLKG